MRYLQKDVIVIVTVVLASIALKRENIKHMVSVDPYEPSA